MKNSTQNIIYWSLRILGIITILFLAIFAFDAFEPGRPILEMILAFLMHLMPNYLLLFALIFACKKEWNGGLLFILIGLFFTFFFQTYHYLVNFMLVSFPVFLIGILFVMHSRMEEAKQ